MINWLIENYIELFGTLSGLLYLYFEIKQNLWLWPLGIITSILYIVVFFQSKFYADMSLQFYYVGISMYGWYWWLQGKSNKENKELPVKQTSPNLAVILGLSTLAIWVLITYILIRYTDSPLPYWDGLTTALSITATYMLTQKLIEQWGVWLIVNFISMGLYIYKGLYPTVILFFFYAIMSIVGYLEWKKSMLEPDPQTV